MFLRIVLGVWVVSFVAIIWLLMTAPNACPECEGPVDEDGQCLARTK